MSRILVIDDDEATANLVAEMLAEQHQVRVATDAHNGLVDALGFVPHAVILDLRMPGMGGLETARRLRNLFGGGVRLVALTGWQVQPQQILAAGFDALLQKPASAEAILRAVETRPVEA
jgi:CheY-like chemotaxis protein